MAGSVFLLTFCCWMFRLLGSVQSFDINDTTTLYNNLLKGYNKHVRGTENQEGPTDIALKFSVVNINGFDEVTGTFAIIGYFELYWKDARMAWDKELYNGVTNIAFPQTEVWIPVIIHSNANGNDGQQPLGADWMLVRYFDDGTALWTPGALFETYCAPNVKNYPYDNQICQLHFVPSGYLPHEVKFHLLSDKINQDLYSPNGVWDLVETDVTNLLVVDAIHVVYLSFVIARRATFFIVNMIFPIGAMGLLNLLVFVLPANSGERVGYSITILLAICVFLTIASDNLPKTSFPTMAVLSIKLLVDLVISTFAVFFTIIGLRFYHKDDSIKVPACYAAIARCVLCRCCKRRPKKQVKKAKKASKVNHIDFHHDNFHHPFRGRNQDMYHHGEWNDVYEEEEDDKIDDEINPVTWADIGVASDVIFFTITAVAFLSSHAFYSIYIFNT